MTARKGPEAQLLLASLHPHEEVARRAIECATAGGGELDWDWLLDRAEAHKVEPLVAWRLLRLARREALLPAVIDRAEAYLLNGRERAERARASVRALAGALESHGIDFLVVKGCVLAEWLYDEPGLRRFYDIDLVVRPGQVADAERALQAIGYAFVAPIRLFAALGVPRPTAQAHADAFVRRYSNRHHFQHHYSPPHDQQWLHVDLHWRLLPAAFGAPDDVAPWATAVPRTVAGVPVRTLETITVLVHQALHAMRDQPGTFRLQPLVDLAWILVGRDDATLRQSCLALARQWRAEAHFSRALEMIGAFFPGVTTVPAGGRAGYRTRAFAPLLEPETILDYAGSLASSAASGRRRTTDTLRWRLSTGDLARTLGMKAAERFDAQRWSWSMWRSAAWCARPTTSGGS